MPDLYGSSFEKDNEMFNTILGINNITNTRIFDTDFPIQNYMKIFSSLILISYYYVGLELSLVLLFAIIFVCYLNPKYKIKNYNIVSPKLLGRPMENLSNRGCSF